MPEKALYILNCGRLDISFVFQFLQFQLVEGVVGQIVLFGTPSKQRMEVLIRMVVSCWAGGGDVGKVFQYFLLQHIDIHRIGGLLDERVDILLVVMQCSLTDFLRPLESNKLGSGTLQCAVFNDFLHTHRKHLLFVETVGSEVFLRYAENQTPNF